MTDDSSCSIFRAKTTISPTCWLKLSETSSALWSNLIRLLVTLVNVGVQNAAIQSTAFPNVKLRWVRSKSRPAVVQPLTAGHRCTCLQILHSLEPSGECAPSLTLGFSCQAKNIVSAEICVTYSVGLNPNARRMKSTQLDNLAGVG